MKSPDRPSSGNALMLFKRAIPYLLIAWIIVVYSLYFFQFKDMAEEVAGVLLRIAGNLL